MTRKIISGFHKILIRVCVVTAKILAKLPLFLSFCFGFKHCTTTQLFNGIFGCFHAKLSYRVRGLPTGVSELTRLTGTDWRGIACQRKLVSDDIGRRSSDENRWLLDDAFLRIIMSAHIRLHLQSFDRPCNPSADLPYPILFSRNQGAYRVNSELECKPPTSRFSLPVHSSSPQLQFEVKFGWPNSLQLRLSTSASELITIA